MNVSVINQKYPNFVKYDIKNQPSFGRHKVVTKYVPDVLEKTSSKKSHLLKNIIRAGAVASILFFGGGYVNRKLNQDTIENDVNLYISADNANVSHKNSKAECFINGLISQKPKLQSALKLSDQEYNNLALLAIGIANEETCMGLGYLYTAKYLCPPPFEFYKYCQGKVLSKGLSNIKIEQKQQNKTRALLDQFGINADNIYEHDKAAAATIIMLTEYKNTYEREYKKHDIKFDPQTTITLNEYMLARYKGLEIKIQDGLFTKEKHSKNIKAIIEDRGRENPKRYIGKILKATGLK